MNKQYQIAHIYPNSPTTNEVQELKGLERLGANCEEFENKIALCKDFHGYYDDHKTKGVTNMKSFMVATQKNSYKSALEILNEYKQWVENQKGYSVLESADSRNAEKIVQRTLHGCAGYYCKANGLDISPESNTGRGPVDFKISRGTDKTVIEIKLTSNSETVHGFEVQIEEYAKSEETDSRIFLLVDNGKDSYRIKQVEDSYEQRKSRGEKPTHLIIIDAKPKDSASNYKI